MQLYQPITKTPANCSDGMLAEQALAGDQEAFEALVHRYSTSLFSFIYQFLDYYDRACYILQQVFLQLYLSLATLRTNEPLKPWLFQVARNRSLDEIRQRNRQRNVYFSELESTNEEGETPMLFSIPDNGPQPEELAERNDLQARLRQAIGILPPKFRAVVYLRYTAQLSFAEIGQVLNMPTATAKTYFQRAKPLLREHLHALAIHSATETCIE